MAQFDPKLRRETLIFQKISGADGKPAYRQMKFALVQYDGEPDKYIEPLPPSDWYDGVTGNDNLTNDAFANGRLVAEFLIFEGRPFPMQGFDDNIDVTSFTGA